ncbi:MAG: hypothetical protein PHD79_11345 [Aliarcobacter sp.]|nr:hypothetical protein [Aliarcobacter sp.]
MNHPILQYTPQLEQDLIALHTGNNQAKQWFYQSVINILENQNLTSFTKADQIADAFISLDVKLDYIIEQQRLLASLKKQIEIAKELAKEEVSKALLSFGVTKLEGMKVSSITASKETVKSVAKLQILNEEELLKAGYFKVELDFQAIEEALLSGDRREEAQDYADMKIEKVVKNATIRINKRKNGLASDELSLAA